MRTTLMTLAKLLTAGAVIFGIGSAVVVLSPQSDAPVSEAKADITDLAPVGTSPDRMFTNAMEASGLESRPYDLNGNAMMFGSGTSPLRPHEVIARYQELLVEHGINDKAHLDGPDPRQVPAPDDTSAAAQAFRAQDQALKQAMVAGDVVPVAHGQDYAAMAGVVFRDQPDSTEDLVAKWGLDDPGTATPDPEGLIEGMRFVDATWNPHTEQSEITAVWSNGDFSVGRMEGQADAAGQNADLEVPGCIGCRRLYRVESLAKNEPYSANGFLTDRSVPATAGFYEAAMRNRGWKVDPVSGHLEKLKQTLPDLVPSQGRILNFERGTQQLSIVVAEDPEGSQVTTIRTQ